MLWLDAFRIFEGLLKAKAVEWPGKFLNAITPGADLSLVTPKFLVWLMVDFRQYAKDYPDIIQALDPVRGLYQRIIDGGTVSDSEWNEAARAAAYEKMADKLLELLAEAQ